MKLAFRHLVGLDAEVLDDDLLHPLANITHRFNLVSFQIALDRSATPSHCSVGLVVVDGSRQHRSQRESRRDPRITRLRGRPSQAAVRLPYFTCAWPASARAAVAARKRLSALQIIAIPPLTCSVWPVT